MKNILHLIPTDKPSRLSIIDSQLIYSKEYFINPQHIYITSDEEIKEGDWVIENHTFKREPYIGKCFYPKNDGTVTDEVLKRDLLSVNYEGHYETLALKHNCKKIILTTDQDLIKDGVQAIDDEFLEWFVKNPSCEYIEVESGLFFYVEGEDKRYKIIIPQEEPKQEDEIIDISDHDGIGNAVDNLNNEEPEKETLEEAAENFANSKEWINGGASNWVQFSFKKGAKWQSERMYSEEEMIEFYLFCITELLSSKSSAKSPKKLFEQFKKK
jgi:hypothetical protein